MTDIAIDIELVRAALTGDVKAFGRLVERHHGAVVAVAYAITRNLASAEDIAQETFCTAWTGLGALRDPAAVRAWLCNIARNRSRNALRSPRHVVAEPSELVDDTASVRDAMVDRETATAVQAALADVPEAYREPLVLFYWEGQSIESVADALAITSAAAQKRISRARAFLKEELASRLADVGRGRRSATVAAAAIVAVCSTRQVASAGVPAASAWAGPAGVSLLAKLLVGATATAVLALVVLAATGNAPWQSSEPSSTPIVAQKAGSATVSAPAQPTLAARPGSNATTPATPPVKGRKFLRGGFGTPGAYEVSTIDATTVAVNLTGGPSGVYLFEPHGAAPSFMRTIRGRVTDANGSPVAHAVVVVGERLETSFDSLMGEQGALTNADGTFNITTRNDKAKSAVALHPQQGWSPRVAIAAGADEVNLAIAIQKPGALVGKITRGDSPLDATVSVLAIDKQSFDIRLETDTRGTFELPLLPPGNYKVIAGALQQFAGGSSPPAIREVTVTSGSYTKLELDLPSGSLIVASVKPAGGVKLSTVEYTLVPGTGTYDVATLAKMARNFKARSYLLGGRDVDREAQFHDVVPGTYTFCVEARVDHDQPAWPLVCRPLKITADQPHVEVEIDVKP